MSQFGLSARLVALGVGFAFASSAGLGCGGSPPKPAAPPAAAAPVVTSAQVSKEEAPDLTPVSAPPELFVVARFKNPETAIETVSAWANFPFKLPSVLPAELRGLGPVLAWDAPLELAVALDPLGEGRVPEPLSVLSVGLSSLDGALEFARAHGQSVHRLRPGVYRVGDSEDVSCIAGVAVGTAPARLVCGHRAHDVDGLFNYATRGLPSEPLPDLDFQLELRVDPLKKKYGTELGSARLFGGFLLREVQIDNPRFDRALSDVAYGLIDETLAVVHDLDKVRIDARIDRVSNLVNLRFEVKFSGQQSWLSQAIAEVAPSSVPPPEAFWQLPADAADASYGVGWKPGRLKPVGHALGELFDAYLEAEKVPAALRGQGSRALEGLFELSTSAVRADGSLVDTPSEPLLAAGYRFFGWQVTELTGDSKPVLAVFDGLFAALGSRDLPKILKQRAQLDVASVWPKFSARAVSLRGYKPGAKSYRVELPRGLLQKLVEKRALGMGELGAALAAPGSKAKPAAPSLPLSIIVASDGEHAFVAISPDEKALLKRLESLKEPKAVTLRSREGLEALKSKPHLSGGFLSLRRFGNLLGLGGSNADAAKLFNALPQHGDTPILFSSDTTADGPDTVLSIALPRAAIGDLGTLVPVLALTAHKSSPFAVP